MASFKTLPLTGSLVIDGVVVLFALYLVTTIRSCRRLSHITGSKLWGWSVLPLFRLHLKGEIYDKFGELNDEYGPLDRVAPDTLLCSDSDELRRMSEARSPYTRSEWYVHKLTRS